MAAEASWPVPDGEPEPDSGAAAEPRDTADPRHAATPGGVQWIEGSADAEPAPRPRDGLRWSWELDLGELLSAAGLTGAGSAGEAGEGADQEAVLAGELAAIEAAGGRDRGRDLTGLLAEHLPAGPGLAAWLAAGPSRSGPPGNEPPGSEPPGNELAGGAAPGEWSDWDLPGVAAAFRRVASWAQAGELAACAAIASRTAARDPRIGAAADGRPGELTPSAVSEVSLALSMSHVGASWWAGLGVALQWRLAATGTALAAGDIDVPRARLIAEATAPLSDELAREVEARVLPDAGQHTTGQLRAALRRAVIVVDPRGADDRRREAELQADVKLYPNDVGTASLVTSGLPAVQASAAMARLAALARGMRASGAGGRLGLLMAQAHMGLVLGTLPLIPPGPGAPPDPDGPPEPDSSPEPGSGGPQDPDPPAAPEGSGAGGPRRGRSAPDMPGRGPRRPRASGRGRRPAGSASKGAARDDRGAPRGPGAPPGQAGPPGPAGTPESPGQRERPGAGDLADPDGSWRDVPPPGDADLPPPDGAPDQDPCPEPECDPYDIDRLAEAPAPAWAPLPATIAQVPPLYGSPLPGVPLPGGLSAGAAPPGAAPPGAAPRGSRPAAWPLASWPLVPPSPPGSGPGGGRPPPGLLDLTISWAALTGQPEPAAGARLSRIGPITAAQALPLAVVAAGDPHAAWRVVLIGPDGRALAVERVRRRAATRPRAPGVTGRVTVVVPAAALAGPPPATSGGTSPGCPGSGILTATWRAARRAAAAHAARRGADTGTAAAGAAATGCAHTMAAPGYRPPPRIREHVTARDQTCRHPTCRQPAGHADLDHTIPYDQGGPTCPCDLGTVCRTHHQIKQGPGWTLTQPQPGTFHWTTPAGRTYTTRPDPYDL